LSALPSTRAASSSEPLGRMDLFCSAAENETVCATKRADQRRIAHLIDEEHGEICCVGADPLPRHLVGTRCSPSTRIAGSEDLVGKGRGDEGNQGEEGPHVEVERAKARRG
jgi:hypothetical protein